MKWDKKSVIQIRFTDFEFSLASFRMSRSHGAEYFTASARFSRNGVNDLESIFGNMNSSVDLMIVAIQKSQAATHFNVFL